MKFQKIDQKQAPQVVILVVLTVAILGYAGFQFLGGSNGSAHADTNTPPPNINRSASAQTGDPGKGVAPQTGQPGQSAAGVQAAVTQADGQPGAAVPGAGPAGAAQPNVGLGAPGYNPDPFRSPAKVEPVKPVVKPAPVEHHQTERWPGNPGELPNPGGPGVAPGGPTLPVPPPAPVRPTLTVTGIIDVQGGTDMALVETGSQQRIVQVGDQVDAYKVKKIDLGGILLVNGKDKYYAGLASTEKADGKG
jgi:hypothetical protein